MELVLAGIGGRRPGVGAVGVEDGCLLWCGGVVIGLFDAASNGRGAVLCEGHWVGFLGRGLGAAWRVGRLTDVLARVGSWPQGWIDELMPDCWWAASV